MRIEKRKQFIDSSDDLIEDIHNIKLAPDAFKRVDKKVLTEEERVMMRVAAAREWTVPPFKWETDLLSLILEIVNGAFGTFPYNSMAYYCKTNSTSIPPTLVNMWNTYTDSWD